MKTIKVILKNGVIDVIEQSRGTRLIIHDYDVQDREFEERIITKKEKAK